MRHVLAVIATLGVGLLQASTTAAQDAPRPIGTIPLQDILTQLDRNGNGCIDLEEGRNYVSRRFHNMDRNGDGSLDAAEAPPGPGETTNDRPISIQQWQDAYGARFDSFDTTRDGCLSLDEIAAGRAALAAGGTH